MSNTYGKEIFNTVRTIVGKNKTHQRNYTDKCVNVRKYKICTKESVSNSTLQLITTNLLKLSVPVTKIENYTCVNFRGMQYNKVIISTAL